MNDTKLQIGFWTLFAIVVNAQLGASIFLLPTKLAALKTYGLIGWVIGGIGAVLLATVFGFLCLETSKSGGPHIYARMFFGDKVGFFVTWLYWCGAWACNPILISTSIDYLEHVIGVIPIWERLLLEISIVVSLTLVNIKGIKWAGCLESVMVIIKLLPLIIVPILAFQNMNMDHFVEKTPVGMSVFDTICKASIIGFWGFVGLEEGGSTADSVTNPKRTVPLAIILGTSLVAIISLVNTFAIFGVIPLSELENQGAPFAEVLGRLIGGSYDTLIGTLTFVMCYGSLNAWVLFSGKLSQTAARENMFPKIFGKSNKANSPTFSLCIAALGTIIILAILECTNLKDAMTNFLDMSVVMYIVLYLVAVICFITHMVKVKNYSFVKWCIAILAFVFCSSMLVLSNFSDFTAVGIILLLSIPVYIYWQHEIKSC